jgi:hypothetical protein
LDFLNKEGVSLKDIDVDSATFQCFVYDRWKANLKINSISFSLYEFIK